MVANEQGNWPELAQAAEGVELLGVLAPGFDEILSPQAIGLVAMLERRFGDERRRLLERRGEVQARLDAGEKPEFLAETAGVREADWSVAPLPDDLQDRRVEITGPVDRKMVINALNSGASVFMADFEDASTPTWSNLIEGHINLRDAVRREIAFSDPNSGKEYSLAEKTATLLVRPRGWHLQENHVRIDGRPVSASLFDFGLYFFHNAQALMQRGSGPYFYLPKLESHLEARLWNDVFVAAQEALGVPQGTIKATVLIETILAAFEMDEILHELRQHSAGLNCGRWDYIFSFIKKFRHDPACVLPDRAEIGMTRHLMRSYSLLTIKTCHRRGVHAIGGMAAQIPIKNDAEANEEALAKVRADKEREAGDGHDGTWVAHPGLVPIAKAIFDDKMPEANQIARQRQDVATTAADLLRVPDGPITAAGLRQNVNVGIRYLEAWLRGVGCVPLNNLMEDAATAEISRSQVWQWIRHGASLDDGRVVDRDLFQSVLAEEMAGISDELGDEAFAASRFEAAAGIFAELITGEAFVDFLTLPAYEMVAAEAGAAT
ncbi:MAG: malate synthase A [Alphaproteobacteria bacterium]|jgi:malate synthase|nr:malate synthase A [Rhodospirillaceae bacterium]MDP6404392.1 malate synthase A [Alphaproteobacteria bacterium]MDP6621329.1 malate synthase A [Alphaproteobacteria bacterium]|tara:strand:- start:201 stop:1847 length:1647 start_codon:yes stop_codon:yes gene_type:complete